MDIFVGSLPFKLKEADLKKMFEHFGEVSSATIKIDNITRQNKGFGFVVMPNEEEALAAIAALNDTVVMERNIVVSKAQSAPAEKKSRDKSAKPKHNNNRKPTGGFSRKFDKGK